MTALWGACSNGHLGTARWLVEVRKSPAASVYAISWEADDVTTRLTLAIYDKLHQMHHHRSNHRNAVRTHRQSRGVVAQEQGAWVEYRDESGRSPLHMACANGHFELAQWLVAPGQVGPARASCWRAAAFPSCPLPTFRDHSCWRLQLPSTTTSTSDFCLASRDPLCRFAAINYCRERTLTPRTTAAGAASPPLFSAGTRRRRAGWRGSGASM